MFRAALNTPLGIGATMVDSEDGNGPRYLQHPELVPYDAPVPAEYGAIIDGIATHVDLPEDQ